MSVFRVITILCISIYITSCTHSAKRTPQSDGSTIEKICTPPPEDRSFKVGDQLVFNIDRTLQSRPNEHSYILARSTYLHVETELKHPTLRKIKEGDKLTLQRIEYKNKLVVHHFLSAAGNAYAVKCTNVITGHSQVCTPRYFLESTLSPAHECTDYKVEPTNWDGQSPTHRQATPIEI